MASSPHTLRSPGRVLQRQDRLGTLVSGANCHTNDGGVRQTEVNPFVPDIQEGYGARLWINNFTQKVESARFALLMLHEAPVGQECHSIFASTLRRLGEALGGISTIDSGTKGHLWDLELLESARKGESGLQPLFKLLPRIIRPALLENSDRQKIVQKLAVWASDRDELQRLQLELVSCIEFITSRLDLIKRMCHDRPTSSTYTVIEGASTATRTEFSKTTTISELSSIASLANVANGLPRSKSSSSSASVAASGRQRSPCDSESFQDNPQAAEQSGSGHRLQKGKGGGTRSVSCDEVFDICDEAKDLSHGKEDRLNCTAYGFACLDIANGPKIESWTNSSRVLSDQLELLIPSSHELDVELESEAYSTRVGMRSDADRRSSPAECGRLGSECNTLEGMFCPRIEACPQMADQFDAARHSRSYSMGRWLQCSREDPWSPARPTRKWCSCRINYSSNLSGLAESQRIHGQTYWASHDNFHVEAVSAPDPSGPSEDDTIAAFFEDLSLRQNDDRKCAPTQSAGCANGAQESPVPPHGSRGDLVPSDNFRGKRKAGQSNSNGDNGDENSGDRDGDSGDGGGPGKRCRSQSPQPKNSAGHLPCIYRDTLGLHCGQRWKTVKRLKVHLKSRHGLSTEDMDVVRGGTEEEKWKRLYEKSRGQPAPDPLKWMPDTVLPEPMQQSKDDSHNHHDHSRPEDDSRYSEQFRIVPLGESGRKRFVAFPEEAALMSHSVASDQMSNTHFMLPSQNTINPWDCHTRGHMIHTNQSDTPERAQEYQHPMYENGPVDAPMDQWQPATSMYALTTDSRTEEPFFEGDFSWTSALGEKSLSEAPQVNAGIFTDIAYPGSETRSLSAPNSCSNPSLLTAPTSWGEDLPTWGGDLSDLCTCVQHIPSCVEDFNVRKCLCWGCGRMMPALCVPGLDTTLRICQ